jgi:uncharacterized protein YbjT (DUF2867 family)
VRVLLFGATGMVGQGVLRECLRAADVAQVVAVVRRAGLPPHEKLRELVHADMGDLESIADEIAACDACFYCLGVSAAGMSEADYTRVTYDYTLAAAKLLAERRPGATFIYVSGQGTNEHARALWSRVKGRTERDVLALPLKAVMFRPGLIRPDARHQVAHDALPRGLHRALAGHAAARAVRLAHDDGARGSRDAARSPQRLRRDVRDEQADERTGRGAVSAGAGRTGGARRRRDCRTPMTSRRTRAPRAPVRACVPSGGRAHTARDSPAW